MKIYTKDRGKVKKCHQIICTLWLVLLQKTFYSPNLCVQPEESPTYSLRAVSSTELQILIDWIILVSVLQDKMWLICNLYAHTITNCDGIKNICWFIILIIQLHKYFIYAWYTIHLSTKLVYMDYAHSWFLYMGCVIYVSLITHFIYF